MEDTSEISAQQSTLQEWTAGLAESSGFPGGGAGSGVMLSIAAAMASMVAGYSPSAEEDQERSDDVRDRAQSLRKRALELADDDAKASAAFGAAFHEEPGPARRRAIADAALVAAEASADLGEEALRALPDFEWLAQHGRPSVVSDVVVGLGALRAALAGARTNVSFDLATLTSAGESLEEVHRKHPRLWEMVTRLSAGLEQIDELVRSIDDRAAPTEAAESSGAAED
ncbi:cyclodeaminase/cyclohydrolase family protein [Nesterenkonia massiliensis]|uniref:Cyclodeaminase/cyclohydrolase family protein n=1 Tax=Nesterenkonia massiliensis TaxID=1232429 RepID=A0ABT2HQP3_9MICC|nr:cyclodeaminase/cyclohydrolase family protein [Nesterenkonia massiliensis]MCT1607012.1 cyclodeaminase/cyclohydrolase family protein [Nesterenkonia massiliensis]